MKEQEPRARPIRELVLKRRDFLIAAGALGIAACAPGVPGPAGAPAAGPPRRGGTLRVTGSTDFTTFDPWFSITPLLHVSQQFYNQLVDFHGPDPTTPNPQLAESWQETDKTLTLKLRQGVKFHNGREFTSQDVADNLVRSLDEKIGHYLSGNYKAALASWDVIDKYTIRINYKGTYPRKFDDLVLMYIIPKEAMDDVAKKPVGTGPFKLSSFTPGDKLEMVRFDEHWQKERPYLDGITVKILPDAQARLANLVAGSVDIESQVPLADVERLSKEPNLQIVKGVRGLVWFCNVLNTAKKPLDNKLVRQALNFTIDRPKIIKLAYSGLAPETQVPYPETHWAYSAKWNAFYKFDLDRAKSLLAQAGFPNGFDISIHVSPAVIDGSREMAQVWAQDLAKVGVTLKIKEFETGPFYDLYFKGDYEIQAWIAGSGASDPADIYTSSPYRIANNKANIQTQPFFDQWKKLFEEGLNSIDRNVRKPVYEKVQQMLVEEGFVIHLAHRVGYIGLSKRVKGFKPDPTTYEFWGEVWLEG